MSLSIVHTRAALGVNAPPITVEVHISKGLPGLTMVGLPETTVKEVLTLQPVSELPDMSEILRRVKECSDLAEKQRIIAEYNQQRAAANGSVSEVTVDSTKDAIYDARDDMEWVIKRASNYGLHFLFCFDMGRDFINLRIDENAFRHKILFPMSKDESIAIMGSRKANEIGDGTCLYSNGKESVTLRPHIYIGLPCNGWTIDDTGKIVQRGDYSG